MPDAVTMMISLGGVNLPLYPIPDPYGVIFLNAVDVEPDFILVAIPKSAASKIITGKPQTSVTVEKFVRYSVLPPDLQAKIDEIVNKRVMVQGATARMRADVMKKKV